MREFLDGGAQDERFFIVTTGRSGSSLLAATLAKTGANFGMLDVATWDARAGAMEHPDFERATRLLEKAQELSPAKPADPFRRLFWNLYRHKAKHHLGRALEETTFVKSTSADLALQMAIGLGYTPRVIVSYRRPEAQIASHFVRGKYWSVDYLIARYIRVMRNALGAVRILGGCVVSYDDLHDSASGQWADALAGLTGLDRDGLIEHRTNLLRPGQTDQSVMSLSPEAERLWREAEEMQGLVFSATRPAIRARCNQISELATSALLKDLENNPICSVSFDASVPCIAVVWKSYATSEQFRYIHEQILMLLKKHGVGKVLGDDTVVPLIHARDQIWITNDWFPRAVAAGLKVGASKKPVAQSRQAPIDRIQSQTPSGLTIRSFDDLEDARRWLKNSG